MSTPMNCEYAKNDSTEGRAPMYGHSAEQTARRRLVQPAVEWHSASLSHPLTEGWQSG